MSFRRSKQRALESYRWRQFVEQNSARLEASGLPLLIYQSQEMFLDFLIHGYIDHHEDPTRFSVMKLSSFELDLLADIIVDYLHSGFPNPSIGMPHELRNRVTDRGIDLYGITSNQ
jgi:hypothetical protein